MPNPQMEEPDDIPENAMAKPPGTYTDVEEFGEEPSATKGIPDDTIIPYINQTGGIAPAPNTNTGANAQQDAITYKSIWPPLIMAFLLGAGLGSLSFFFVPSTPPTPIQEEKTAAPPTPDTITPGNTRIMLTAGFTMGSSSIARDLAIDRIAQAHTNIIWITNFPNDPAILQALSKREGTPTMIIVGNDASKSNTELARKMKLGVIRAQQTINDSDGFLIIDNQYVIDIGRNNTVWESIDPSVSQTTRKWVDTLLNSATPL